MSLTNPKDVVTEERLQEFYHAILPYLGGMPELMANKISRSDIYSTTEKMVGQWTDGKPLYQKTFYVSALPNNTLIAVPIGATIDTVVDWKAKGKDGSVFYDFVWIERSGTAISELVRITVNNNSASANKNTIVINSNVNASGSSAYITLQYTKTTDSATSIGVDTDYSTTEKIVGSWIDGKPLYQKTLSCQLTNTSGANTYNTGLSNVNVVDMKGVGVRTDGKVFALSLIPSSQQWNGVRLATINNGAVIELMDDSGRGDTLCYVTIQYTK